MVHGCARRGKSRGMSLLLDLRSAIIVALLAACVTLSGATSALAQTPTLNNPKVSVTTATNTPINVAVSATAHPAVLSLCTPNLTFSIGQAPGHGTASVFSQSATAGTAVLRYVPGPGFSGLDAFQYTVTEADIPETPGVACGVGQATGSVSATVFNPATAIPGETIAGRLQPTQDPSVQGIVGAEQRIPLLIAQDQTTNFDRHLQELRNDLRNLNRLRVSVNGQPVSLRDLAVPATSASFGSRLASLLPMTAPSDPRSAIASPGGWSTPPLTQTAEDSAKEGDAIELPDRIGVFLNGNVSVGQITATNIHPDASPFTWSLSTGVDYRLASDTVIGVGGGYTNNTTDIGGGSQTSSAAYNFTLYGTTRPIDPAYIDAQVSYGRIGFNSRRNVAALGVVAGAKPEGNQVFGAVAGGWEFVTGPYTYGPYLRLNGSHNTIDPYSERGAGAADINFGRQTVDSLSTALGFRGDRAISTSVGILSPHLRVEYLHEFEGPQAANVGFSDGSASGFLITGYPVSRNYFTLGLGASFLTANAISAFFDYDALVGYAHQTNHSFTVGASARF